MLPCFLDEYFSALWKGKDVFKEAFAIQGDVCRNVKNRKTIRFTSDGKTYFVKLHRGTGWGEIIKNLVQFKAPVLGASNEFVAIRRLESAGVKTMTVCAFAERRKNPAKRESFIITKELSDKTSLEDVCASWKDNPPPFSVRKELIKKLAATVGKMHASGVAHRDCYICHFLLDNESREIYVLDLHRGVTKDKVSKRLLVKDLGGIFFSAMDLGLSERDSMRFVTEYSKYNKVSPSVWRSAVRYSYRLYRKEYGKTSPYA